MCGRFAFFSPHEAIARLFGLHDAPAVEPHYNIAPTQFIAAVRHEEAAARRIAMLYWGLVPSWAKEKSIGAKMINARAETVAGKPSFRSAFKRRRCLVLADGYYEWQVGPAGKQPHFIRMRSGQPFAMAGVWEAWREGEGNEPLESCAIITTAANAKLASVYDRMPVILEPAQYDFWMDRRNEDTAMLSSLLVPYANDAMEAVPVSKRVNNARNDEPGLVDPSPRDQGEG
ncbi:MAG TPA: SOS response-associated peptidase [Steroidobacteraceae bacterium]|nr:SOS response-associated peptidase [Steroidobacteraceae bacterium]